MKLYFKFNTFLYLSKNGFTTIMSVAKKDSYLVTLLPGDGIGPEIISATIPSLNAVAKRHGFKFSFQEADIGGSFSH